MSNLEPPTQIKRETIVYHQLKEWGQTNRIAQTLALTLGNLNHGNLDLDRNTHEVGTSQHL